MVLTLELEQRIAERTAELSRVNAELVKEVAERIRAEAEITQLNRDLERRAGLLEVANQELDAVSASLSHDLRNPLSRILGFASLLQDLAGATLGEKGPKYIRRIIESAEEMRLVTEDLMRFWQASHIETQRVEVDFNNLLESVLGEFAEEIRSRNIHWKQGHLPVVWGDPYLLRQVLVNLISNALNYSRLRDPAEIEIDTRDPSEAYWVIFVRDNGVGFDPMQAHKVFAPFQRLHDSREFERTGVELANVRRIVLRHAGKVWAEGRPGEGATFYFSLPRNKDDMSPADLS